MFIFVIILTVLTPPAFAARLDVPVLRQYIIQSNDAYQNEEACQAGVAELLTYTEEQRPMYKLTAEVECYKSVLSPA
jgi:hypothetical protein